MDGYGECVLASQHDPGGLDTRLWIRQADPRILIAAELLYEAFIASAPGVSLSTGLVREDGNGTPFWEGAVLKIEGVNRTVIYRVGGYLPELGCYEAEWPD